ncbi:hypothetical protein LTR16_002848, partial [Cryomyces antarcticus]
MPSRGLKNLVSRRRRTEEGEDEGLVVDAAEDSMSEGSILSDVDEDADADAEDSNLSETDDTEAAAPEPVGNGATKEKRDKKSRARAPSKPKAPAVPSMNAPFTPIADTEAMMDGLKISEQSAGTRGTAYEDMGEDDAQEIVDAPAGAAPTGPKHETLADRRRREHEEYKKKRDADPTFIPNRGNFFMHDHRSAAPGQNGFRPYGGGGGRGRGGPTSLSRGAIGGPFSPAKYASLLTHHPVGGTSSSPHVVLYYLPAV